VQTFNIIDFGTVHVQQTGLVDKNLQTIELENRVALIVEILVKAHAVLKTRAAAADDLDPKAGVRFRLFGKDFLHLVFSFFCQCNRHFVSLLSASGHYTQEIIALKKRARLAKILYVFTYLALTFGALAIVGIVLAVRRQSNVTRSYTEQEQQKDAKVYAESLKVMENTVATTAADALAAKARDPRLAAMTQEDLVYEVLKDCYDPEIPLNVVDLGLIYEVKADLDTVNVKMSMTSQACPSGAVIAEDIKTKLSDAGFPNPKVEVVWEPAWSPQRISEAGRKALGI
jgi:metal-sulfur cluster biosynthetic enzyme